ncbi:MAG TPA: hypothetical protein VFW29_11210, partial [Solirubrobacteraceae bacterium]|nr:hypothetical protein [Solirubrobacteraceae bacterium]
SSVPAYGSGTLGYVNFQAEQSGAFTGASGFLLGEVDLSQYNASTNVAPVTATLIPNIGELALEAQAGTLLRRSQAALFAGLARRPRAGNVSSGGEVRPETDPYIPIPAECVGTACANGIFPKYSFTSSRTDIGDFVRQNLALSPTSVLLDANGEPIPDEESGLFCAYNAGTTIVTISAGGLSASLPVTVQAGSVRRPCGTQKLKELPAATTAGAPVPSPAPTPTPAGSAPSSAPPPLVPLPPAPLIPAAHAPAPGQPPPFLLAGAPAVAPLAVVPPPLPTPARPTPPSGTSAVTSPVEAPEKEEKEEEATESVGNNAVAYRASEHESPPYYLLSLLVLAAFAGAGIRRRPRHGRRSVQVAPASVSADRWQRRVSREERRSR